jgi:MYXO-CTERM domain-containing protein
MPRDRQRALGAPIVLVLLASTGIIAPSAGAAIVQTYEVGLGSKTSTIQLDFSSGDGALFTLHYDGAPTSWSALQTLESQVPGFALSAEVFPFGVFVTGLGVGGLWDFGTGDQWPVVENYWHFWTRGASGAWESAGFGPSDRVLVDGSADAWVFGSPAAPQEVPAPAAGALLALAGLTRTRRRRGAGSRSPAR